MKHLSAFTFIEVILSVTLLGLLALMPSLLDTSIVNQLQAEVALEQVGQGFRKAQLFAKTSRGDSSWGIYISGNTITVFRGNSYATRNPEFDDVSSYDSKTSLSVISGNQEIVFAKVTGVPNAVSTVQVTQTSTGKSSRVSLTPAGGLVYE